MENKTTCFGCGVFLQITDKDKLGYVPKSAFEKDSPICQRCFFLQHYNEVSDTNLTADDFLNTLQSLNQKDALIVKVIDIFDFEGSWLNGIQRFAGNNKVVLVGNKRDLLPKGVNPNKLINWMKKRASDFGLKPAAVLLVSAKLCQGILEVMQLVEKMSSGKDVYVVGCTNVGKSSFINAIIKVASGKNSAITTSQYPGTTLNVIGIPLDDGQVLWDTPGIINNEQIIHFIKKTDISLIMPKKEIKSRNYQLNTGQTLFFGGLARLDFIKGERNVFVCYMSNELLIHRTKLAKADVLYERQLGKLLVPSFADEKINFNKLVRHEFSVRQDKMDIVFFGLGWVTVTHQKATVVAYAPKGVGVSLRKSLI